MARLELGPNLIELRSIAEAAINRLFANATASLAVYAMKTAEARRVAEGGESALIIEEAKLRGTTPEELANLILAASASAQERELERVRLILSVREASGPAIRRLLADHGIQLTV